MSMEDSGPLHSLLLQPAGRRRLVRARFPAGVRRPFARIPGGRLPAVAGAGGGDAAPRRRRGGCGPGSAR